MWYWEVPATAESHDCIIVDVIHRFPGVFIGGIALPTDADEQHSVRSQLMIGMGLHGVGIGGFLGGRRPYFRLRGWFDHGLNRRRYHDWRLVRASLLRHPSFREKGASFRETLASVTLQRDVYPGCASEDRLARVTLQRDVHPGCAGEERNPPPAGLHTATVRSQLGSGRGMIEI